MITRRILLAGVPAGLACTAFAQAAPIDVSSPGALASFARYIAGVKAEAIRKGMKPDVVERAFVGVKPNRRVIELDRHQPEVKWTWAQYRDKIITADRIRQGRAQYARHRDLLAQIQAKYHVSPNVIMGIWGLESNYGPDSGKFSVIESTATLAWEGRREAYFRSELLDALRILNKGDVPPARLVGSYAGAMGQPQFMPDSFLKYATDWSGSGGRNIWTDTADVLASIAAYLSGEQYNDRLPWGRKITLPAGFDAALAGHGKKRTLADWARSGVQVAVSSSDQALASVILPGGIGEDAYFVFWPNYRALRDYNPSDYYCIAVGTIGDAVVA